MNRSLCLCIINNARTSPLLCCTAGVVPDGTRGDLLEEVTNLVESPTVVLGTFDPTFLSLPRWVLVRDASLLSGFIVPS